MSFPRSLFLYPLLSLLLLIACPLRVDAEQAKMADDFVDAAGFNTHFNHRDSPYVQLQDSEVKMLAESGVRHIRDGGVTHDKQYIALLNDLWTRYGIGHNVGFRVDAPDADIISILDYYNHVDFVSQQNEFDSDSHEWVSSLRDAAARTYRDMKSTPQLASIPVLAPPVRSVRAQKELGDISESVDYGNIHVGVCGDNPGVGPKNNMFEAHAVERDLVTPGKPVITTETGYNTNQVRPCSVTEDVQAKYLPRKLALLFNLGEPRIYFYQFSDMPSDAIFGGTGLLHGDATPKLSYTAMQSMLHLLSDKGPVFTPGTLNYDISGDTAHLQHTLLEKRDGTFWVLLWNESSGWIWKTKTVIPLPPQSVKVEVGSNITSASLYTYDDGYQLNQTPLNIQDGAISMAVTDRIAFLALTPASH